MKTSFPFLSSDDFEDLLIALGQHGPFQWQLYPLLQQQTSPNIMLTKHELELQQRLNEPKDSSAAPVRFEYREQQVNNRAVLRYEVQLYVEGQIGSLGTRDCIIKFSTRGQAAGLDVRVRYFNHLPGHLFIARSGMRPIVSTPAL